MLRHFAIRLCLEIVVSREPVTISRRAIHLEYSAVPAKESRREFLIGTVHPESGS